MDGTEFLDRFLALLQSHQIRYCVIGGQAVNAYAEPVVSLDLDLSSPSSRSPRPSDCSGSSSWWSASITA